MKTRWQAAAVALACAGILLLGAGTGAAETFNLQFRAYCRPNTNCGYASEAEFRTLLLQRVGEMNLEFKKAGISFRPNQPQTVIITYDMKYSGMTDGSEGTSLDGFSNADLDADLVALAGQTPEVLTIFLIPNLPRCWNGIPCPGSDEGFDGDDVIFCTPSGAGTTLAHEMGHMWCLRHTFTGQEPGIDDPFDRDLDDGVCIAVTDTPGDPGVKESDDNLEGHEWCDTVAGSPAPDPGSPHTQWCTPACKQVTGGVVVDTGLQPLTSDAMSYYSGSSCRGPYVINGVTTQPFTASQRQIIQDCREQVPLRAALVDYCANKGGDSDSDGWCDQEDACPNDADTDRPDSDGDGIPDACDLCPNDPTPTVDTDGDGMGDACDPDDDQDSCLDGTDQNPTEANPVVGTIVYPNCDPSSVSVTAYEGDDSDGDGIKNCEDPDDDNDGIPDETDACPLVKGIGCIQTGGSCPLTPIWDVCQGGGCVEFLLRLVAAINPDPTRQVIFDRFSFVGRTLWVHSIADRTLSETAKELEGESFQGGLAGAAERAAAPSAATEPLRLQVVDRATGAIRAAMVYDPSQVRLGAIARGVVLRVGLPEERIAPMTVDATWAVGAAPGQSLPDRDKDGVPDMADTCLNQPNLDQADYDHDGFGDRCDADFDQSGRINWRDFRALRRCLGADLKTDFVDPTDGLEGPPGPPPPNPQLLLQQRCGGKDLDGNGRVDKADLRLARARRGLPPGPSGVAEVATKPRGQSR
jgi:hypothetical protein